MKIYPFIVGLFAALSVLSSAHSQTTDSKSACLDSKVVAEIRTKVNLKTKDVETADLCDPDSQTYKILEALIIVKTLTFEDTALAEPFSQHILPKDFWGYFSERADQITDEATCKDGVLAFVFGAFQDGNVHICPDLYKDEISKYERAETMLHEVRHFEGFGHVTCTHGPRKGQDGACDNSIGEKGSYAVTVEALTKMALNSKDVSKVEKTILKIKALTYANEAFNEDVRPRELRAFLLVDQNSNTFIYSDQGAVAVASQGNSRIISRGPALAVFPADKGDAYTANVFSAALDVSPALGTFSIGYNAKPIAERPVAIDILNLGYLAGAVTENEVSARLRNETEDTIVPLPFKAVSVFSGLEFGQPDEDSLYVLSKDQSAFRIQILGGGQFKLSQVENTLGTLEQISVFNGQRLARDQSGQILIEEGGQWKTFPPLAKARFKQMTRPFLWDQYFEDPDAAILAM